LKADAPIPTVVGTVEPIEISYLLDSAELRRRIRHFFVVQPWLSAAVAVLLAVEFRGEPTAAILGGLFVLGLIYVIVRLAIRKAVRNPATIRHVFDSEGIDTWNNDTHTWSAWTNYRPGTAERLYWNVRFAGVPNTRWAPKFSFRVPRSAMDATQSAQFEKLLVELNLSPVPRRTWTKRT
jgi:L-lactate permease